MAGVKPRAAANLENPVMGLQGEKIANMSELAPAHGCPKPACAAGGIGSGLPMKIILYRGTPAMIFPHGKVIYYPAVKGNMEATGIISKIYSRAAAN
jgi:hypothetical protein